MQYFTPDDMPEEMKEQIKQHMDRQKMAGEVGRREFVSMLETLTIEQATFFGNIFHTLATDEGSHAGCAYLSGILNGLLYWKHDILNKDLEEHLKGDAA